jgi:hypothetical protein
MDLIKHEKSLSQLYQTIHRLQNQYQQQINLLFYQYFQRFDLTEKTTTFVSYTQNEQDDYILFALSAMYESIIQLTHATLDLGTTIHQVIELETTDLYQPF